MPRARNKDDLMKFASENYATLMKLISKMTETQLNTPFDFSGDKSKKEAHWSRDKNVRDVLIHLYEWHLQKHIQMKNSLQKGIFRGQGMLTSAHILSVRLPAITTGR